MVKIVIPGEPVAQGRPRVYRTKYGVRGVDPAKSRDYKKLVAHFARENYTAEPMSGPVAVDMTIYRSIQVSGSKALKEKKSRGLILPTVKPDIDNVYKAVSDALTGIVYADDNQITDLALKKRYSLEPHVEITITRIVEADE